MNIDIDIAVLTRSSRRTPQGNECVPYKVREVVTMQLQLPRRAINALLYGRHGSVGGKTMSKRARHLTRIAAAYAHDELLAEHGVGATVAAEIQIWLREPHLLASIAD